MTVLMYGRAYRKMVLESRFGEHGRQHRCVGSGTNDRFCAGAIGSLRSSSQIAKAPAVRPGLFVVLMEISMPRELIEPNKVDKRFVRRNKADH